MGALRISLLGSMQVSHDEGASPVRLTRSMQTLLAFLLIHQATAVNQRTHPRDVLAALLWGDLPQERARASLNTLLWRLRSALEPPGIPAETYLLTTSLGEIGFNREACYWLDIAEFESQTQRLLATPCQQLAETERQCCEKTLGLYHGELLEGFYEDWVLRERERLRLVYLSGLAHLMLAYRHAGEFDHSLLCGQRILSLDPLREEIHREQMRTYLAAGQRPLAVRQYEACARVLQTELDILPMPETAALYIQAKGEERAAGNPRLHSGDPDAAGQANPTLAELLRQVQSAAHAFDSARAQLDKAIQYLEKYRQRIE